MTSVTYGSTIANLRGWLIRLGCRSDQLGELETLSLLVKDMAKEIFGDKYAAYLDEVKH